jgi:hypothetical protein
MFETVTPVPNNTFCTKAAGDIPGVVVNCALTLLMKQKIKRKLCILFNCIHLKILQMYNQNKVKKLIYTLLTYEA